MIDWNSAIGISAGSIAIFGGIYTAARHLHFSSKVKKEMYREEILARAKEEADRVKKELESRIRELEEEFKNQKEDMSRDMGHLKQTFNGEIKSLGEKIENLREDLSAQHSALIGLLTRLVDIK